MKYTHYNHELNIKHLGQEVYLKGWVQKSRNLGGLIFVDLRDRFGITQLMVKPENTSYEKALKLRSEFVIEVKGVVIERESKNLGIPTGEIEIEVSDLEILSAAETPPMAVTNESDALEETRLKYRYLDLRRPVMQNFLIQRHKITQAIRSVLVKEGFYELETPILGKSTPEGARDFLVPSRLYAGHFYALPQSPQIYKQLFMVAGFEKYFQIARCFRDEDLRSDRQLEFTQVDIEASFIDEEDIQRVIENIMVHTFKEVLDVDVKAPFEKMSFRHAMDFYGTDKPDMRYDLLIKDFSDLFNQIDIPLFNDKKYIKGLIMPNGAGLTRKQIDKLADLVKKNHGDALVFIKKQNNEYSGSINKFMSQKDYELLGLNNEDILFLVPGQDDNCLNALGALRVELAVLFELTNPNDYKFVWITDWPLLEYDEDEKRYYAKHHPFTQPKDVDVLLNNPKEAMAKAYDIVLNGYEIGGGSLRIYSQDVQQLMFKTLGLTDEDVKHRFGFFVDALKYGTPPHGGLALGLDRIVMLMTHTSNIKDVVAFPKTQSAKDQMMQAPSDVDEVQLEELHLKIRGE